MGTCGSFAIETSNLALVTGRIDTMHWASPPSLSHTHGNIDLLPEIYV